ncbi:hypothetical protein SFUMM280S_04177 [Streptomyces fumanus]
MSRADGAVRRGRGAPAVVRTEPGRHGHRPPAAARARAEHRPGHRGPRHRPQGPLRTRRRPPSARPSTRPYATSATSPRSPTSPNASPPNCPRPPRRSDPTDPGRGRPSPNCPTRLPRAKSSEGRRGRSRWLRHDNDRASPIPAVHPHVTRTEPSSRRRNNQGRPPKPRCANLVAHDQAHPFTAPARLRPHGAVPTTRRRGWHQPSPTAETPRSAADRGFMLICSALVMHMTQALAFFYGGMVRVKSTLNMLMVVGFVGLGVVRRPVGAVRVLHGVRHGFRLRRRLELRLGGGPERHRPDRAVGRLHHPGLRLPGLPAHVRGHHPRPDQRRPRGPRQVHRVGPVHRPVGHDRVLPGRPLGVGHGRLGLRTGCDRLRRRYRRAHQRRCRRARRDPRHRQADRLQEGPDAPRTACRWSCSARACCGSAGSASTRAPGSATTTAWAR